MGQRKVFAAIFCLVLLAGVAFAVAFLPGGASSEEASQQTAAQVSGAVSSDAVNERDGAGSAQAESDAGREPAQTTSPSADNTESVSEPDKHADMETQEIEIPVEPEETQTASGDRGQTQSSPAGEAGERQTDRNQGKESEKKDNEKKESAQEQKATEEERKDSDVIVNEDGDIVLPEVP